MARPSVRGHRLRRAVRHGVGALLAGLLVAGTVAAVSPPATAAPAAPAHTVTFDRYSMQLDGVRTFVWSGEFHPFRLPSPGLWRDVLQKMKAEGYDAVSFYFDWAYHSPAKRRVRLQWRPRPRPVAGHRRGDRALRHRPARALHQRRDQRRWPARVDDDPARPGPHERQRLRGGR